MLAITGYTMREYVKIAREIGYLNIPEICWSTSARSTASRPHKIVMMVTGSQGEPSAVLGRLAVGRHRYLTVEKGDTIVLSSHPIPGNEETVYRTIDQLIERGANVVYEPMETVHVSGHARAEEMRLMLNLVQPEYLMPVHGETRHLHAHANLAVENGMKRENIIVAQNGTIIEVDKFGVKTGDKVPAGYVFIDGSGVGDIGPVVIRDREVLARDGFLIVSVNVDNSTGRVMGEPEIVTRGFVYLRESEQLLQAIRERSSAVMSDGNLNGNRQNVLEDSVSKFVFNETGRRPMVFSIINRF